VAQMPLEAKKANRIEVRMRPVVPICPYSNRTAIINLNIL